MSELMKRAVSVACSAALVGAVVPAAALSVAGEYVAEVAYAADSTIAYSGTWGTCAWEIDSNGVLTIHEGEGVYVPINGPWYDYRNNISSIKTDGVVTLPYNCSFLFEYLTSFQE